jgi:hypothetical protein
MSLKEQATSCAWCLEEQGQSPQEEASHGICQPHANQLILNYHWQKLQSVPSYVETQATLFAQEVYTEDR